MTTPLTTKAITVRASGSTEPGLTYVGTAFWEATGCAVHITFDDKVGEASDPFDVVVASVDALNRDFRPKNKVEAGGVRIGSMSLGVPIRAGAEVPDVSSMGTLMKAIQAADALILTTHTSGLYFENVLKKAGIFDSIASKIERSPNGPILMDRLLRGSGKEFGVLSINQARRYEGKGITLAGALPLEAQQIRDFIAVPMADSRNKEAAWAFVNFCGGPGKAILNQNGFN